MKTFKYLVLSLVLFFNISSNAQVVKKNHLMAVFIHKFTDYINWSDNRDFYNSKEFKITFIGKSPFSNTLKSYFKSIKINNKQVIFEQVYDVENIQNPEILFISEISSAKLIEIITYTQNKPILTISNFPYNCEKGVLINFYIDNNKLRFEINKKALKKSNIKVDSYLFRVAKVIE